MGLLGNYFTKIIEKNILYKKMTILRNMTLQMYIIVYNISVENDNY